MARLFRQTGTVCRRISRSRGETKLPALSVMAVMLNSPSLRSSRSPLLTGMSSSSSISATLRVTSTL